MPDDAADPVHRRLGDDRRNGEPRSAFPQGNLAATLERYNEFAANGEDPDFHKQPEYPCAARLMDRGQYSTCRSGGRCTPGFTMGGLAVTVDGQVLRADDSVVPGLYAVGACASNIAQDGKGYASGTQLGEGSFFGRRAGAHAAGRER